MSRMAFVSHTHRHRHGYRRRRTDRKPDRHPAIGAAVTLLCAVLVYGFLAWLG